MKHVTYILFILAVIFLDTSWAVDLSTESYRADFLRGSKSELMSVTKGGVTDSKEIKFGEKAWSEQVLEVHGLRFNLKRGSQDRLIVTRKNKKKIEELTYTRLPKSQRFVLTRHQLFPIRKLYHEAQACFLPGHNQKILDILSGTVKAEEIENYKKRFDPSCKNLPNGMGDRLAEVLASLTGENSKIRSCLENKIGMTALSNLRLSVSKVQCRPLVKEKSNYQDSVDQVEFNSDAFPMGKQFDVKVGLHEILHASCFDLQKPTAETENQVSEVVNVCLSGDSAPKDTVREELSQAISGYKRILEQEQKKDPKDEQKIATTKQIIKYFEDMVSYQDTDLLAAFKKIPEMCRNLSDPETCPTSQAGISSINVGDKSLAEDRAEGATKVAQGPAIPEAEVKSDSGASPSAGEKNIASGPPLNARPAEVVTEIAKQMPTAPEVQKKSEEVFRPIESRQEVENATRVAEASFKNGGTSFDLPVPKDLSQVPTIEYSPSSKNLADFVSGVGAGIKNTFASANVSSNSAGSRSVARAPASVSVGSSSDESSLASVNKLNLPKPVTLSASPSVNPKPRVLAKGVDPNAVDGSSSEEPSAANAPASKEKSRTPASVAADSSRASQVGGSTIAPNAGGPSSTSFSTAASVADSRGGDSGRAPMPLAEVRQLIAKAKPAQLVKYAEESAEFRQAINQYGIIIKQGAKVLLSPTAKPNSGRAEIWLFDLKKNQWIRQ